MQKSVQFHLLTSQFEGLVTILKKKSEIYTCTILECFPRNSGNVSEHRKNGNIIVDDMSAHISVPQGELS